MVEAGELSVDGEGYLQVLSYQFPFNWLRLGRQPRRRLFAPPNFTVLGSLLVAAVAVCDAIFLIFEMYYPYTGLI